MSVTPLRSDVDTTGLPLIDTEVEQALLGAILINNAAYGRVAEFLAAEHFGNAVHGRIYAAIGKLIERGQTANPVILKNLFDQDGALAKLGGAQYLAKLAESTVTIINAEHYGRTVHDLHLRRQLITIGQAIVTDARRHDLDDPVVEQVERVSQQLLAIRGSAAPAPPFIDTLNVAAWLDRKIPEPYYLMGEIFSTTSRAMFVADTGLGKTNLALALSFAMAQGSGFLHWGGCGCPVRILYIDGEMSKRLFRTRIADAARRAGAVPATLYMFCRDEIEDMPPLNTPGGQRFIDSLIKGLGGVDFVIFDNIQALLIGDMKDEESWQQTLPWIRGLTARSIGQLWIHHTGHDAGRAYGTKTREWQLDAVILAEAVERPAVDIGFSLKFIKARDRSPNNRSDFDEVTIILRDDEWSVEAAAPRNAKPPSPKGMKFYDALVDAMAGGGAPHPLSAGRSAVTSNQWRAECIRLGLLDGSGDSTNRALFSKYRLELIAANWIVCNQDFVWSIRQHP